MRNSRGAPHSSERCKSTKKPAFPQVFRLFSYLECVFNLPVRSGKWAARFGKILLRLRGKRIFAHRPYCIFIHVVGFCSPFCIPLIIKEVKGELLQAKS